MKKKFFLLFSSVFLFFSCGTDFLERENVSPVLSAGLLDKNRKWTVLVYMAADNNLESEAITDLNEMEVSALDVNVTVLALVDRAQGFDATNGDWTDTRLYKIIQDNQVNKTLIASERLDCPELGLSASESSELDMSNPATLSGFLSYARRKFPAENFALILWGHGTGWRNSESEIISENNVFSSKAFAIDNSSYMTISALRRGIEAGMGDEKLSVIGFDTCFGICLETAYELCDSADFMIGSPGLVASGGWNYSNVFARFSKSDFSQKSFLETVLSQFREEYASYPHAVFSCLDLSRIRKLVEGLSFCAKDFADSIDCQEKRDQIFTIFREKTLSYYATSYPTDFYVDLRHLIGQLSDFYDFSDLSSLIEDAVYDSWSSFEEPVSMGLFFTVYSNPGVESPSHPAGYYADSKSTETGRFVRDCSGYVPSGRKNYSLLDKLFYSEFDE